MGCMPKLSSCCSQTLPNPDPRNFDIRCVVTIGDYIVVRVHYPDCANYEGNKIMVYEGVTLEAVCSAQKLDPHFCESANCISPIARFEPTDNGWENALLFAANKK